MKYGKLELDWEDLAWDHEFRGDDKAMLSHWYTNENQTMLEIGERIGICATTVSKRMRALGIEIKPPRNQNCGRGPRLPGRRK